MSRRTTATVSVLAALTLLTTACSGHTTDGNASPTNSSPAPTSTSTLPFGGAPKVVNPLPASVLSGNPCTDALTPTQVNTAVGSPTESKDDATPGIGPLCSWSNHRTSGQINVGYDTGTHTGLSGSYQNTQPRVAVWRALPPIQGFPAVAYSGTKGMSAPNDSCTVSVGLADDLSVDIGASLGSSSIGKVDPCDVAAQVAALVVTTLRQKAGA
jgi:Protein of unknown function (DUF3558)